MCTDLETILADIKNPLTSVYPLESKAMKLAIYMHDGQMYGDKTYFWGHIVPVYNLIKAEVWKSSSEYYQLVICIAILHDILEDTDATYEMLADYFGKHIAMGVDNLSDVPGKNRRERKLKTYHKIRISPESVMVKVADRLINLRNCVEHNQSLLKMYVKEHDTFYAALWSPTQSYQHWWDEMEEIVSKYR